MNEAKQIRAELKEMGIKRGQVSVRTGRGGYETAIYITVKDTSLSVSAIEKKANKFQKVRYCERSQEMLAGGNTFIFVNYERPMNPTEEQEKIILSFKDSIDFGSSYTPTATKAMHYSRMIKESGKFGAVHSENDIASIISLMDHKKVLHLVGE